MNSLKHHPWCTEEKESLLSLPPFAAASLGFPPCSVLTEELKMLTWSFQRADGHWWRVCSRCPSVPCEKGTFEELTMTRGQLDKLHCWLWAPGNHFLLPIKQLASCALPGHCFLLKHHPGESSPSELVLWRLGLVLASSNIFFFHCLLPKNVTGVGGASYGLKGKKEIFMGLKYKEPLCKCFYII